MAIARATTKKPGPHATTQITQAPGGLATQVTKVPGGLGTQVTQAPDPMQDPVNKEKVELARDFAFHLLKGVKQIGMYRHNESKFPEFLQQSVNALNKYTETHGPLGVKVEGQNFYLLNQNLFSEDTPLAYKFFRDGIRNLIFRPEMPIEELVSFTMIALSEPERGADDILAQLWKSSLEHVEYVVVEGFKMDEYSEEEVQVEVDQVVGYLYARLKTESNDFLRFARVSTEDLDVKLEGVDQIRGAVIGGLTATDDLKARIQREVEEEENARLFPKLVSAVFQVVEGGVDDPMLLEDMFIQLLDALIMQEDFATINQIVLKLKAMEQRSLNNEGISRLRQSLITRMGEEQRLTRLGEILKATKPKNINDFVRYLQALETDAIPGLLTVLETIEIPENRILLCDVLAGFAREMPDPFVARLESERPQTVRDMVYVLEKCKHPDRLKMFQRVLLNPNLAVRLEVMSIVARGRTGENRKLIESAMHDANPQVRMLAYRLLPEFDREKAYSDLARVTREPGFEKRTAEERTALYSAIGSTGVPNAFTMLKLLIDTKPSLLNRSKVLEDKLLAVHALQAACSVQSYKMLAAVTEDRSQPVEVLTAARRSMYAVKKALFGEGQAPEE